MKTFEEYHFKVKHSRIIEDKNNIREFTYDRVGFVKFLKENFKTNDLVAFEYENEYHFFCFFGSRGIGYIEVGCKISDIEKFMNGEIDLYHNRVSNYINCLEFGNETVYRGVGINPKEYELVRYRYEKSAVYNTLFLTIRRIK